MGRFTVSRWNPIRRLERSGGAGFLQEEEPEPGKRLGVLETARGEPPASLVDGDLDQVDVLSEVRVLLARGESFRRNR